jgi:hypothetical protein
MFQVAKMISSSYFYSFFHVDFTTDSWRSKVVAVLIFATVYVQLGVLILGYIGVSPENVCALLSKMDDCCKFF